MLKKGARAAVMFPPPMNGSTNSLRSAWRDAMTAAGLPTGPDMLERGNYTFDTGRAAGEQLLDGAERFTAIFASNDVMAAGVLHAARTRGLSVPQELSIVGFDDTAIAATIWPPLTTVRWPIRAMASSAALKLIHPEAAAEEKSLFLTEFVPRASVAGV